MKNNHAPHSEKAKHYSVGVGFVSLSDPGEHYQEVAVGHITIKEGFQVNIESTAML